VGAYDLAFLGYPRYTGDIDIWINPSLANAKALITAIGDFGINSLSLTVQDILSGNIIQLGYPPVRIDILTILDGITVDEILASRQHGSFGQLLVFYLGRAAFIKNKRATGRLKDLADLEAIGEIPISENEDK
jgi:DNA mismatch repair protein MutH